MNKDTLKKHHFWILLGLVPVLVLIALILTMSEVGAEMEEQDKKIKDAKQKLDAKKGPKPNALLAKMDDRMAKLGKKKTELWKENWDAQKALFTWPRSPRLEKHQADFLDPAKPFKFGDKIPDSQGEYDDFKNEKIYDVLYSSTDPSQPGMVNLVAPTQFPGGWQNVVRYVSNWGTAKPTSDELWLALEDIWVQREMLKAVQGINQQISEFKRVEPTDPDPLTGPDGRALPDQKKHRKFRNRTWDVDLEIRPAGNKTILAGKLTNRTDRLQLLGIGNTMTLRVWLDSSPAAVPFEFKIGGEFVPGKGAPPRKEKNEAGVEVTVPGNVLNVVTTEAHTIPPGNVEEIFKVEHVVDPKTVPVRQVCRLELGYPDSRNEQYPPQPPSFIKDADTFDSEGRLIAPPVPISISPSRPGARPGSRPAPSSGGVVRQSWPVIGRSRQAAASSAGASASTTPGGEGSVQDVLDANKKRYLDVTPQVRRLPVAIVMVTDQTYLQDVELAFANLPLRFEITQVNFSRFRGTLPVAGTTAPGSSAPGSTAQPGAGIVYGTGGKVGEGFDTTVRRPRRAPQPPPDATTTTSASTVSESQFASSLVEVTVYGVVSLYEKYLPTPETPAKTGPGPVTPAPTTPRTPPAPAPAPGTPAAGLPPAPPTYTPPKRRRRTGPRRTRSC